MILFDAVGVVQCTKLLMLWLSGNWLSYCSDADSPGPGSLSEAPLPLTATASPYRYRAASNPFLHPMPIKREPLFFTKKEAANRLIALKADLNVKERIVLSWHSSVWYPNYNPMAPETALNSRIKLQLDDFLPVALEAQLTEAIQFEALKFVLDESNSVPYRFVDKEEKIPVGRFVDIKFYRWKSPEATKIVSVWLGTWEIAPKYSYRLFNSIGVVHRNYQTLTSYAHLL